MPDISASSSFLPVDPKLNWDLKLEAAECRRHGYVLSGKFLGQGAYAKVYLGKATDAKINTNMKLRSAIDSGQNKLKVFYYLFNLIFILCFCKSYSKNMHNYPVNRNSCL